MEKVRILGIQITNREKEAGKVQEILTTFGCSIKTRLGLHEVSDNYCSTSGLILLELTGDIQEMDKLENALYAVDGTETRKMEF